MRRKASGIRIAAIAFFATTVLGMLRACRMNRADNMKSAREGAAINASKTRTSIFVWVASGSDRRSWSRPAPDHPLHKERKSSPLGLLT